MYDAFLNNYSQFYHFCRYTPLHLLMRDIKKNMTVKILMLLILFLLIESSYRL